MPKKKPKLKPLNNGPLTVYDAKMYITSRILQEQLKCNTYVNVESINLLMYHHTPNKYIIDKRR